MPRQLTHCSLGQRRCRLPQTAPFLEFFERITLRGFWSGARMNFVDRLSVSEGRLLWHSIELREHARQKGKKSLKLSSHKPCYKSLSPAPARQSDASSSQTFETVQKPFGWCKMYVKLQTLGQFLQGSIPVVCLARLSQAVDRSGMPGGRAQVSKWTARAYRIVGHLWFRAGEAISYKYHNT